MLAKGQPHIHFSALTVAWIKLTSVCLVPSIKRHSAHMQEMGGERERGREGMWWEGYEEKLWGGTFRELWQHERARHWNLLCLQQLSWEKGSAFLCSSLSVCCPPVRFNRIYSVRRKRGKLNAHWSGLCNRLWSQKRGLSRGSVKLAMKYSLCNFICDNICPRPACHRHNWDAVFYLYRFIPLYPD